MAFWNSYPFTDYYRAQLDWIIARMKEIAPTVARLQEIETSVNAALARCEQIATDVDMAEQNCIRIEQICNNMLSDIEAAKNSAIEDITTATNTAIDRALAEINAAMATIDEKVQDARTWSDIARQKADSATRSAETCYGYAATCMQDAAAADNSAQAAAASAQAAAASETTVINAALDIFYQATGTYDAHYLRSNTNVDLLSTCTGGTGFIAAFSLFTTVNDVPSSCLIKSASNNILYGLEYDPVYGIGAWYPQNNAENVVYLNGYNNPRMIVSRTISTNGLLNDRVVIYDSVDNTKPIIMTNITVQLSYTSSGESLRNFYSPAQIINDMRDGTELAAHFHYLTRNTKAAATVNAPSGVNIVYRAETGGYQQSFPLPFDFLINQTTNSVDALPAALKKYIVQAGRKSATISINQPFTFAAYNDTDYVNAINFLLGEYTPS